MTTQVIPAGSDRVSFLLAKGSHKITAEAGKRTTIEQIVTLTQQDIENGTKTVNLGTMTYGTHTFRVTVNDSEDMSGEFLVSLKQSGTVVETAETVNHLATFTITATDDVQSPSSYTIEVKRDGYKTVTQPVDITVAEFRASASEVVDIAAGSNTVMLTVVVYAPVDVAVEVE